MYLPHCSSDGAARMFIKDSYIENSRKIYINGLMWHILDGATEITYDHLCSMAGVEVNAIPTVTYSTASKQGEILPGESAPLEHGGIYNVHITNNG